MNMGWWGMGSMAGMGLWALVLLVAGVVLVVWLARSGGPAAGDELPERIVKRRYARGEIDREEYLRRLEDLRR